MTDNTMKIIFLFLFIFLLPLITFGQVEETKPVLDKNNGILFWHDNEWSTSGDKKTHGKYVGEIKNRQPNGLGILVHPTGFKYVGEWKAGNYHGQGLEYFFDASKYIGEFMDGGRWNVILYDKDGNILLRYVNGELQ